jgi:hypothetical protein
MLTLPGIYIYIYTMSAKWLLLFFFLIMSHTGWAQPTGISDWLKLLSAVEKDQCMKAAEAVRLFKTADSATRHNLFAEVKKAGGSHNKTLAARALMVEPLLADVLRLKYGWPEKIALHQAAVKLARQTENEYLLADCLQKLGDSYNDSRQNDKALLYLLKSFEYKQQHGFENFPHSNKCAADLGGVFFKAEEYDKCIYYTTLGISMPDSFPHHRNLLSAQNLVAISYQRKLQFDSAAAWFKKVAAGAAHFNDEAWTGIVRGNIGFLKMEQGDYTTALPLMWDDYYTSLAQNDTSNAGNTLQRIAFIHQQTGKKDSALQLARKAFGYTLHTSKYNNPSHRMNAGKTLAAILQQNGYANEAIKYLGIYHQLKDSMQALVTASRLDRIQMQIDYETSVSQIDLLKKRTLAEKQKRRLLAVALLLLLASGILFLLWTRQKNKLKEQTLLQEKQLAEAETKAANERLANFTQNIVEKNELIDQLQLQLESHNQQVNDELIKQTILTDEDWRRFKDMFERVYPGFFKQLQSMAPDITAAEMRMASVIRLGLGNKYIASMLGVSGDTVRKAKFRLRQRLQLGEDKNLEDFVLSLG